MLVGIGILLAAIFAEVIIAVNVGVFGAVGPAGANAICNGMILSCHIIIVEYYCGEEVKNIIFANGFLPLFSASAEINIFKLIIIENHHIINYRNACGNCDILQARAISKGSVFDVSNPVGNYNVGQCRASAKCSLANLFYR